MPRLVAVVLILIVLPAAVWGGYFLWHFTDFLHGETVHQAQMAHGDGEIPLGERVSSYVVWIPFGMFFAGSVWMNFRLLVRVFLGGEVPSDQ